MGEIEICLRLEVSVVCADEGREGFDVEEEVPV